MTGRRRSELDLSVGGLDEMIETFRRASGPVAAEHAGPFEAALAAAFAATDAEVHVRTGALRASGFSWSRADGDTWEGAIEYAGDPGIFELGHGDYFFDGAEAAVPLFEHATEAALDAALRRDPNR